MTNDALLDILSDMKIEMINEHQIRCTLTREDLESRQIDLSELTYGSEKAKSLFRDMMQQAADDFGFEADDIPLMIEAIPLSKEAIMLIISKVDAPDELDTRFSSFSHDSSQKTNAGPDKPEATPFTDLSGLIAQIHNGKKNSAARQTNGGAHKNNADASNGLFSFTDMDAVILLAHQLSGYYDAKNTLYHDEANNKFYLVMHQGIHSRIDFDRILHTAAKYLQQEKYSTGREAYCLEHYKAIFPDNALQNLAKI